MALTDSLIAYWKLDEASGDASDSVGSNTLTDHSSVGTGTGKINGARHFTKASGQFLTIADNTALSTGDIDFTIAGWVNADSLSSTMGIICKWLQASSQREYRLDYASSRFRWLLSSAGTSADLVLSADNLGAPSTGTWYFIVAWHDSVNNVAGIQVNDGTANTSSYSSGVFNGTAGFDIGTSESAAGIPFDGLVDEVGFWKRILTSGEKTQLYNGGNGLAYPFSTTSRGTPFGHRGTAFSGGRTFHGIVA